MKLADAADFFLGKKVEATIRSLLLRTKSFFDFVRERQNRIVRFGKVCRDYRLGHPVKQIAKKYGCSTGTVIRYARLAGLPYRPKSDHKAVVLAMLQLGKPYAEIAARTGLTLGAISMMAKRNNLHRYKR